MYARAGGRGQNGANSGTSARAGMAAAITPMVKSYQTVGSSGSDGGGGGGVDWNSLNPNLYQNMSNDQVDWAALAQQWIQMKETLPPEMVPAAPPPPVISWNRSPEPTKIDEQGEAPMEVEDPSHVGQQLPIQQQPWQNGSVSWQYPAATEWHNPAWDTNWDTGSGGNQAGNSSAAVPAAVNPQASLAVANWQAKMSRIYKMNEGGARSDPIAGTVQPTNNKLQQKQQQPFVADSAKRIPGLMDQVINLDHGSDDGQGDQDEDTTQTINDAKRKLLPAWIREGLEKMEREKQRQFEREREQKQREQMLEQRRQAELEALSELENAKKKSKFESDSEEEEHTADGQDEEREGRSHEASPEPVKSREEILQEPMIAVRKKLTEILLEVTNEEIAVLAKETLAKTRRKAPTAQALRKTGLATLSGGLGLGIYGDSDDDDDEDDEDGSGSAKGRGSSDAELEEDDAEIEKALRNTIKQRQKEFEWTAREIEDQLAQEEAREERKRREYEQQHNQRQTNDSDDEDAYGGRAGFGHASSSVGGGSVSGGKSGSRDGETQPVNDKIYAHKLGRTRDKRISRFSDPKDTVRQTHITHVAIVTHKVGEIVVPTMQIPKAGQVTPTATMISSGISPPVAQNPVSAPLFPAAANAGSLDSYRRGNSVASETPSNASSSRASSSYRSSHKDKSSSSSSRHRSHKSKKHKRSRYSRSDDENDCYTTERDDDRYSQYSSSRRSRSSERSSHSRRRRSFSRDSRDDTRGKRRSRSPRDHRYRSSRRSRSRTRSPLSRRGRY